MSAAQGFTSALESERASWNVFAAGRYIDIPGTATIQRRQTRFLEAGRGGAHIIGYTRHLEPFNAAYLLFGCTGLSNRQCSCRGIDDRWPDLPPRSGSARDPGVAHRRGTKYFQTIRLALSRASSFRATAGGSSSVYGVEPSGTLKITASGSWPSAAGRCDQLSVVNAPIPR